VVFLLTNWSFELAFEWLIGDVGKNVDEDEQESSSLKTTFLLFSRAMMMLK